MDSGGFCAAQMVNVSADRYENDCLRSIAGLLDFKKGKNDEKYFCFCL